MANIRNTELINAQKVKLNENKAKKRKVAIPDSNRIFADIERIKAAQ